MTQDPSAPIRSAELVLPCADLDANRSFFTETLGFRIEAVIPADDPAVFVLSGYGLRLRLERGSGSVSTRLRLLCDEPDAVARGARELTAPNGVRIELVDAVPRLAIPRLQSTLVVTRAREDAGWTEGRAGMSYRDLLPGRLGGRFVASHIRIADGGPVGDWVHFHRVRFQLIYCLRGWVRVVYEDQGEPFVLEPGDCVLQPPEIRHRVLECSDGLEVVEIGCPAEHETLADHALELPTATLQPDRDFGGQRFVRHEAGRARWEASRLPGFEARSLGLSAATGGLAEGLVHRRRGNLATASEVHDGEFRFGFVLGGSLTLHAEGRAHQELRGDDCWSLPPGLEHRLEAGSADCEFLEVSLPAPRLS